MFLQSLFVIDLARFGTASFFFDAAFAGAKASRVSSIFLIIFREIRVCINMRSPVIIME